MGKAIILKYLSLTLIALIALIPFCATGFIWFDLLIIIKVEASLLWLTAFVLGAFIYFGKADKVEEVED